jgi:hypothetical protein
MSVRMTSTCMPQPYARYSAVVSAIRGVEEEDGPAQGSILLKVLLKEVSRLHVDSHGPEDNCELVLNIDLYASCVMYQLHENSHAIQANTHSRVHTGMIHQRRENRLATRKQYSATGLAE